METETSKNVENGVPAGRLSRDAFRRIRRMSREELESYLNKVYKDAYLEGRKSAR